MPSPHSATSSGTTTLLSLEGWEALAVGIVLASEAEPSRVIATLSELAVDDAETPRATHFRGHALGVRRVPTTAAAAFPLFDALMDQRVARVSLSPGQPGALAVTVQPGARRAV